MLFAVDPAGLGGVVGARARRVRCASGGWRGLRAAAAASRCRGAGCRRTSPTSRLLGGLDLAATLRAGRPVAERGLLAEADGGVIVAAMAERVSPATAAHLAAALDPGEVVLERDGLALRTRRGSAWSPSTRAQDERRVAAGPRCAIGSAFHLDLDGISVARSRRVPVDDAESRARARALRCLPWCTATRSARPCALRRRRSASTRSERRAGRCAWPAPPRRSGGAARSTAKTRPSPPGWCSPPARPGCRGAADAEPEVEPAAAEGRRKRRIPTLNGDRRGAGGPAAVRGGAARSKTPCSSRCGRCRPRSLASLRRRGSRRRPGRSRAAPRALQHAGARGRPAGVRRGPPRCGRPAEPGRDAACGGALAAAATPRPGAPAAARSGRDRGPPRRFPRHALQAASRRRPPSSSSTPPVGGAEPAGRGEGCGRTAARRLLRAPRPRRAPRLPRALPPSCCCRRRARWCGPSAASPACRAVVARRSRRRSMRRWRSAEPLTRRGETPVS